MISKTLKLFFIKAPNVLFIILFRSNLVTEIDGMIGLAVAVTGEDEITIIGVYESSKAAQAASDTVQKVFYDMASLMTSSPDRGVYSGVWFSK